MRRLNRDLFRKLIERDGMNGRAKLAVNAKISTSMVDKLLTGNYPSTPSKFVCERICEYYQVSMGELFPEFQEAQSAS